MKYLIKSVLPILIITFFSLVVSSCNSSKKAEEILFPEFFVENQGGIRFQQPTKVVMPVSRTALELFPIPVLTGLDIAAVKKVKVDLGYCLLFQMTTRGSHRLFGATGDNVGKRMVLTLNRNAIGFRLIDGTVTDGNLFFFVEYPDEHLDELIEELNESLPLIQKGKHKK